MKSLRRMGTSTWLRTASRSARDPPKRRRSVSTLIADAPPFAYSDASDAGSGMSASSPLLGLLRFTSAMIDTPGSRKAAIGSSAGRTSATLARSSASGVSVLRCSRSSTTPATIPSRTFTFVSLAVRFPESPVIMPPASVRLCSRVFDSEYTDRREPAPGALRQPGDLHHDVEVGRPLARIDALERCHVMVVTPDADADVLLVDLLVVGGVVVPPTTGPRLNPRMTLAVDGVPHLGIRVGMQVAGHVPRRNTHAAQHGQAQMGEV